MSRRFAALAALTACLATVAARPVRAQAPAAVAIATGAASTSDSASSADLQERFLAKARLSYLDRTGRTPLPPLDFLASSTAAFAGLSSLAEQAAYVEAGRGDEGLSDYASMVVLVAARLGVTPPETALAIYRDRVRPAGSLPAPEQARAVSEIAAEIRAGAYKPRCIYLEGLIGTPPPAVKVAAAPVVVRRGAKNKRRRAAVAPPPEPPSASESALATVDWDRAEELASAAEKGAQGWYTASSAKRARREQRKRRGRCYEWVRLALQKTGLWTDDYRDEVPLRGDRRRSRRAFSFAWAMNALETREQKDPDSARKAPLQRLDLRIDPLVVGSILVFDRSVCGFNARSGHIEVVSSIEPLRASSYKFHEVKLPCLIEAANAGRVHVYVPRRVEQPG
ncbi:MAG: hypothetical protein ACHQ49_15280 [Elusimicrobiota bacterium]